MTAGVRRDSLGEALAWLAHPASVGGLVLLLVNDHVLKAAWPGFVTGKLSDVGGMLMFPPLLTVLLALVAPRLRALPLVALFATGAVFTTLKFGGYEVKLASSAWSVLSGHQVTLVADLTDLLAVPFLALSYWAWRTSGEAVSARTSRAIRAAFLVPLGLFATLATTPARYHTALVVGESNGVFYAGVDSVLAGDPAEVTSYLRSTDDGLTFTYVDQKTTKVAPLTARQQDCADDACYRVVPRSLHVEQSLDSGQTWSTAWKIDGWEYQALTYDLDGITDPATELASLSLVVAEVDDGHVVLVANGRDGLLRRNASGTWERIGFGNSSNPIPLRAKPDLTWLRVLAALLIVSGVLYTWLISLGQRSRSALVFGILAVSTWVVNALYLLPSRLPLDSWIVLGVLHTATLIAAGFVLSQARLDRRALALAPIAAAFTWWATTITIEPGSDLDFSVFSFGSGASDALQRSQLLLPAILAVATTILLAAASRVRAKS